MSGSEIGHLLRPWPEALGQALVLAFLATAALALAVRILLHARGRPTARVRYHLAWGALWVGAGLWVLSLAIARHPLPRRDAPSGAPTAVAPRAASPREGARAFETIPSVAMRPGPLVSGSLASLLGWAWVTGATLLLTRLAGGWLLGRSILRRSADITEPQVCTSFESLVRRLGARGVDLRESCEIEAPATLGGRRSTVLFPNGLAREVTPDVLEALFAHELGHITARDSRDALLQAILDSLLFACPGAIWLSARAREAREHRCDDFAAGVSGLGVYARALATLVDRRGWAAAGVLGASGPRLSDRLRRLAEGEPTMKLARSKAIALPLAATLFGALSVQAAAATARPPGKVERTGPQVPYAYSPEQPGSPVRLSNVKSSRSASPHLFTAVRVRNATEEVLRSVTLVAVLEGRGPATAPARLFPTGPFAVSLEPGEAADLPLKLVTSEQVAEAERAFGTRAQSWLAVLRAEYEDGRRWRVLPREGATKAIDALYLRRPSEVSRPLVATSEPPVTDGAWVLCMDDAGLEYSPGAPVAIRDEPGHFARCHPSGVFVEAAPRAHEAQN